MTTIHWWPSSNDESEDEESEDWHLDLCSFQCVSCYTYPCCYRQGHDRTSHCQCLRHSDEADELFVTWQHGVNRGYQGPETTLHLCQSECEGYYRKQDIRVSCLNRCCGTEDHYEFVTMCYSPGPEGHFHRCSLHRFVRGIVLDTPFVHPRWPPMERVRLTTPDGRHIEGVQSSTSDVLTIVRNGDDFDITEEYDIREPGIFMILCRYLCATNRMLIRAMCNNRIVRSCCILWQCGLTGQRVGEAAHPGPQSRSRSRSMSSTIDWNDREKMMKESVRQNSLKIDSLQDELERRREELRRELASRCNIGSCRATYFGTCVKCDRRCCQDFYCSNSKRCYACVSEEKNIESIDRGIFIFLWGYLCACSRCCIHVMCTNRLVRTCCIAQVVLAIVRGTTAPQWTCVDETFTVSTESCGMDTPPRSAWRSGRPPGRSAASGQPEAESTTQSVEQISRVGPDGTQESFSIVDSTEIAERQGPVGDDHFSFFNYDQLDEIEQEQAEIHRRMDDEREQAARFTVGWTKSHKLR